MATITFDRVNLFIDIDTGPSNETTIQEIYDESQQYLQAPAQMNLAAFVAAGGKQDIGGGDQVGVTLTLSQGWTLRFLPEAGPGTIQKRVIGGNLALISGIAPITPSVFVFPVIAISSSPTIAGGILIDVETIRKILQNRLDTDPTLGKIFLFDDDDVTVLLEAPLFEDIAGTQPYRGQGAERRDRLK